MISATELKNGTAFKLNGKPYKVVRYFHQKIARGGGTVKLSLRNLQNGSVEEKTLSSSQKVEEISTIKKPLQYLYNDGDNAIFVDSKTYEQIEISRNIVSKELGYIKEGQIVDVLFWESKPLSVDIPPKVTLEVVETTPGIKGNTASNMYKPAALENGLQVKVPLFIAKGDKIRVDTRTDEYVERVK